MFEASLLLLGGGRGSRIGGNKLYLSLDGVSLFEVLVEKFSHLFDEIVVCLGRGESEFFTKTFGDFLKIYPIKTCEDRIEGRGPIEGLSRGLAAMKNEWGFLFACDMPSPNFEVIRRIWSAKNDGDDCDVIAPRLDGHVNAVHAFYKISCLAHIENSIKKVEAAKPFDLRIKAFYPSMSVKIIEERALFSIPGYRSSFDGFNTEGEFRRLYST